MGPGRLNSGGQGWQQVPIWYSFSKAETDSSGSVIDTCSPFSQKKNGKQNKPSTNKDFYIKVKKKRKWTKYFTQTRTDVFTRPKHLHKRLKEHKVSGNSHIKDESDPILQFKPPKLEWGVWEWGEANALLGNRSPSVSNFVAPVAAYPLESHSQHQPVASQMYPCTAGSSYSSHVRSSSGWVCSEDQ